MKSVKMMVVDDSMLIRRQITRICDDGEFDIVAQAKNGNEAIEMFVEHRPHIVTMDLTMPLLDGIKCTKCILDFDPRIQILVVSALSSREVGIKALQQGATGFLNKPFTEEQLKQALATVKQGVPNE
jgi:two-component system chemotaxis response regulator CheY